MEQEKIKCSNIVVFPVKKIKLFVLIRAKYLNFSYEINKREV
jgi:hypothetical protein